MLLLWEYRILYLNHCAGSVRDPFSSKWFLGLSGYYPVDTLFARRA